MAEEVHGVGIDDLPQELLLKCFEYLPLQDLLNIRLVSQQFYVASGDSCRSRRNVGIYACGFYKCPDVVLSAFPDKRNLPWSSIDVILSSGYVGTCVNRKIADAYGDNICSLEVHVDDPNYDNLLYMMYRMPNLQVLTFNHHQSSNAWLSKPNEEGEDEERYYHLRFSPMDGEEQITLPSLRGIEVNCARHFGVDLDFLEFVLKRRGRCLTEFRLEVNYEAPAQPISRLLELTVNVARISLELHYPANEEVLWEKLSQYKNSNIRVLSVRITHRRGVDPRPVLFEHLEQFIANCQQLQRLYLEWCRGNLEWTGPVPRLPPIPTLELLDLTYLFHLRGGVETVAVSKFPFPLHSGNISPQYFPALKEVHLRMNDSCGIQPVDYRHLFISDPEAKFTKVKELTVESYNLRDDWYTIFPNLQVLNCSVGDPRCLEDIFKERKTVTELSILMDLGSAVIEDFDIALFRFMKPSSMSGINRLTVAGPFRTRYSISESAAILFSLLPRLDFLKLLRLGKISEVCRERIREQHSVVVFSSRHISFTFY